MANSDDMGNAELGQRLRTLRRKAGLSQRALAKKVSVASATISLMEAGKISPSVGSLKRILEGIPIGLSEFFAFAEEPDETVFYAAEDLSEIGSGRLSIKQIGGNPFGRSLQILKETYGLNADTGRVLYEHEGEEGGIVISGRVEVTVGDQRKILGPGDAYFFQSSKPHRFRQVGPEESVIISACTPPTF
ncbi:HTH-type transcriptional regulator PuuR [Roseovarius litorisediminis]|uniref:HTH-type transcriptional regulator PuuR n=2 Tax=Roseovarius litorisediminis TaxID=1312363 RepID=A0A1Y5T4D6_9RHOB|nr:HTH-type transcriptional regulator PuuR [Roseovarius litorisediminis]